MWVTFRHLSTQSLSLGTGGLGEQVMTRPPSRDEGGEWDGARRHLMCKGGRSSHVHQVNEPIFDSTVLWRCPQVGGKVLDVQGVGLCMYHACGIAGAHPATCIRAVI
jgi:hypothetical protein